MKELTNLGVESHGLETREKAYQLYAKHWTLEEIATQLSIPRATVASWSSRQKWKDRLAVTKKPRPAPVRLGGEESSDSAGKNTSLEEKQAAFSNMGQDEALRFGRIIQEMPDEDVIKNADRVAKLVATARTMLNLNDAKPSTIINLQFLRGLTGQDNTPERIANAHEVVHSLPTSEAST